MLSRPAELISREEMRGILWPDSNVDFEHGLDVLVNRLRMTLGDSSKNPRYIQTVPKKGYRFVGPVRFEPSGYEAATSVSRIRSLVRYAAIAVLAALIALLMARTRYEKFVPPDGAAAPASRR